MSKSFCAVIILLFSLNVSAQTRVAQERDYTMFGYAVNLSEQVLGFRFSRVTQDRLGFFFDLKTGYPIMESRVDFYKNISVNKAENILGNDLIDRTDSWTSINSGVTRSIAKSIAIYGGAGISFYRAYRQYYEHNWELYGRHGEYWIEDSDKATTKINILTGLIIVPTPRWGVQFGIETTPLGGSTVIGLVF